MDTETCCGTGRRGKAAKKEGRPWGGSLGTPESCSTREEGQDLGSVHSGRGPCGGPHPWGWRTAASTGWHSANPFEESGREVPGSAGRGQAWLRPSRESGRMWTGGTKGSSPCSGLPEPHAWLIWSPEQTRKRCLLLSVGARALYGGLSLTTALFFFSPNPGPHTARQELSVPEPRP